MENGPDLKPYSVTFKIFSCWEFYHVILRKLTFGIYRQFRGFVPWLLIFTKLLSLFWTHVVNYTISRLLFLFWKSKWTIMRSPCCLFVCNATLSNLPSNNRLFWLHCSGFQASYCISFKRKLGWFRWLQTFDTEPSIISWYDSLMTFPPDHVRLRLVLSSVILLLSWDLFSKCARFFWAAVGLERGPLSLVNNLRSYLGK
jgi:hypothetical protein